MASRCDICLKTTSNKQARLCSVAMDAEAIIQFGYYSIHQTDLNRSLFGTKVHEKCYRKYCDRWYNQSVRNNKDAKVSREIDIISIDNEYPVFDDCLLSNTCTQSSR